MTPRERLGIITDGAFNATLTARLEAGVSTEGLSIGSFVIVEGEDHLYFSTISDLQLRVTDPGLLSAPPSAASTFVREALTGTSTYAVVQVKPMLMIKKPSADPLAFVDQLARPEPVRTIPMHFAILRHADESDFELVFGREGGKFFAMGTPLVGADLPISLDLERLLERSNGVFGQSGTGKSVLLKGILGLVHHDAGQITLDGQDVTTGDRDQFLARFGMLAQGHTGVLAPLDALAGCFTLPFGSFFARAGTVFSALRGLAVRRIGAKKWLAAMGTLVLTAGKKSVASITIDLGEDSELITRKLTYNAGQPASGTSAKLAVRGATYTVAGTLASAENGSPAGTMPVVLTVACAGTSW